MPAPCEQLAPDKPSVYSDGGLTYPKTPAWALGSFGVHWPGRSEDSSPINTIEEDLAFHESRNRDLNFWAPVAGQRCSSTRAELIAGIMAMCADMAVHIASDSLTFVRKAN